MARVPRVRRADRWRWTRYRRPARRESRQGRASAGVAGRTGGGAGAAGAHEDGGTCGRHRPRRDQVRDDRPGGTVRPGVGGGRAGGTAPAWLARGGRHRGDQRDAALRTVLGPPGRLRRQAPEAQAPGHLQWRVRRPRRRRCLLWAQQPRADDPRGDRQHALQPRAPEPRDHRSAQAPTPKGPVLRRLPSRRRSEHQDVVRRRPPAWPTSRWEHCRTGWGPRHR